MDKYETLEVQILCLDRASKLLAEASVNYAAAGEYEMAEFFCDFAKDSYIRSRAMLEKMNHIALAN